MSRSAAAFATIDRAALRRHERRLTLVLAAAIAGFFALFALEVAVIHFVGPSYEADTQSEMPL